MGKIVIFISMDDPQEKWDALYEYIRKYDIDEREVVDDLEYENTNKLKFYSEPED